MWALKPAKRENASPRLNRELGTISPFLRVIFNSATRSFVRLTKEPFIQLRFARSHGSASTSHFLTRTFTALLSLFCLETCCSFLERVKATVSPYKWRPYVEWGASVDRFKCRSHRGSGKKGFQLITCWCTAPRAEPRFCTNALLGGTITSCSCATVAGNGMKQHSMVSCWSNLTLLWVLDHKLTLAASSSCTPYLDGHFRRIWWTSQVPILFNIQSPPQKASWKRSV